MTNDELREKRMQWFDQMEQELQETYPNEKDRLFTVILRRIVLYCRMRF